VLGVAYASIWNGRGAYAWTVETTVYVAQSAQRRGVGDALYSALLARLRSQGYHLALALIALPNDASIGLHKRHGFRRAGQLSEAGYKLGGWRDVGLWQLRLDEVTGAPPPPRPVEP